MRKVLPLALCLLAACDELLGPLPPDDRTLDAPYEELTSAQLRAFIAGDGEFGALFTPALGLGPIFNASSCEGCHGGDGKGHPSTNLTRFGRGDAMRADDFDYLAEYGGAQLQDRAIPGYQPEALPEGVAVSVRSGPIVVGLGLIEAIPDQTLLALADPDDRDGDGVRGVANFVLVPDFVDAPPGCDCAGCKQSAQGCKRLGRFGRKATAINLLMQTVGAYHQDMGLTTNQRPEDLFNPQVGGPSGDQVADPEIPSSTVDNVVFYLRTLRPPPRRAADSPQVAAGEAVFGRIGCAACHVPRLQTGESPIAALSHKEAALYSDLLLHDMGDKLADAYPEGEATGRQWRTTPLWGLGLTSTLLGGQEFYMHDGAARTLDEAIRLHGGEAEGAVTRFGQLGGADREALLTFLRSL